MSKTQEPVQIADSFILTPAHGWRKKWHCKIGLHQYIWDMIGLVWWVRCAKCGMPVLDKAHRKEWKRLNPWWKAGYYE